MKKIFIYSIAACLISTQLLAQASRTEGTPAYVKLIKERVNFQQVKSSFEKYSREQIAQGRLNPKNNLPYGWKQFKRWEYWWEPRTYPSGNFPAPGIEWQEMQKFNAATTTSTSSVSNWIELGPRSWATVTGNDGPGIGRINVIVAAPNDPNTIYIGAPAGGLWKTTDNGATWTPLTDQIPSMGVSAIAIHPTNPDIILIGTGDRDHVDTYGVGVLKSTDGGTTWSQTSLTWAVSSGHTSARMVVNPLNPNIVLAGTTDGLYRSTDFGDTWTKLLTGDIDDLELKPGDPDYVYALVSKTLYRSANGGTSFASTGQSSTHRSQIAVTPAAPNNVYFFSKSGLFLSTDSGGSFRKKGSAPTEGIQDSYALAIAVSPTNPDKIHVGEIETYASSNGGRNWTKVTNGWYSQDAIRQYVHVDVHELVYINNVLYHGSDGLITKTTDGVNFTDISNGLGIRQFYALGLSKTDASKFGGGSQDNGTYIYTPGIGWHGWIGYDGFNVAIAPDNNTIYGVIQNGTFYKSTTGGTNSVRVTQPGSGAWNTPFVMHPTDPSILYVGNTMGVRKTTNGMGSWTTIGNFNGLTSINEIAIAPSNPSYLYASVVEKIWVTKNGGGTWTEITTGLPVHFITSIAVDPANAERVVVTYSGYHGKKVYVSSNAGASWTNISYNLPSLPANTAVFHQGAGLYVGMDVGIYYLPDGASSWESFMTSLPNVPVTELEIQYTAGKIRAATFGRGMWESSLAVPSTASASNLASTALQHTESTSTFKMYPNPASDVLHVEFTSTGKSNVEMQISDEKTGRTLMVKEIIADKGFNTCDINIKGIPDGVYIVRVNGKGINQTQRIQISK